MIEFTILSMIPIEVFDKVKPAVGMRPLITFQGSRFDTGEYAKIKSIFLDFFRGDPTSEIDHVKGLQHVISITADTIGVIHIRSYVINQLKKSRAGSVQAELVESGPAMQLEVKRTVFCPDEIMKVATYVPKELKPTKVKNVGVDAMGDRLGRIHMKTQDLTQMQTRKMKGLKRTAEEKVADREESKKYKKEE
jgi:ribosome production factor 2